MGKFIEKCGVLFLWYSFMVFILIKVWKCDFCHVCRRSICLAIDVHPLTHFGISGISECSFHMETKLFSSSSTHFIWIFRLVFGAGHLRGSRLLSFFAFYYENNIVWGGGVGWGAVGWDNNVICTSTRMWCNKSVRSLALHSHPHIRHATLL